MAELTGAYINVLSDKTLAIEPGSRGTVAIALPLTWYKDGTLTAFDADGDAKAAFGQALDKIMELREIMKNARRVLVYPTKTGGTAATGTLVSGVTATAAKLGTAGNGITVTVAASGDLWRIKTFLGADVVDSQMVSGFGDFQANEWVSISGTGVISTATVQLANGADGSEADDPYGDFLAALKKEEFNVIAYTGSEASVMTKIAEYVKSEREDEDKFIQAVMGGKEADYEGIISYANGVVLEDGTTLTKYQASAWLAGATAAAGITDSLTYGGPERKFVYSGAVDVSPRMTKSQLKANKDKGLGCFLLNNGKVKVESDINTLVTYTTTKQKDFSKNRVLRVIDAVCGDIKAVFDTSYAGAESNNLAGRNRFKASICDYLTALQDQGALENFKAEDVTVSAGAEKDIVVVDLKIQPVDAMEKAHVTVRVR